MTVKDNIEKRLKNSEDVFKIMTEIYASNQRQDETKEQFYILGLNTKNIINYVELVSMGILSASLVHPREVFKIAIMKDSASIIACHNHPSGDTEPSSADIDITKRLKETGVIVGIPLIDHIIIGKNGYISLMEKGLI